MGGECFKYFKDSEVGRQKKWDDMLWMYLEIRQLEAKADSYKHGTCLKNNTDMSVRIVTTDIPTPPGLPLSRPTMSSYIGFS